MLGVRPLAPGYARAAVWPRFGALTRLAGRAPTPHGLIELNLTREGGTLRVPAGVTAEVVFEDVGLGGGELAGGTWRLSPGAPVRV